MLQYFFCNQEESEKILKNIPHNEEYEALIYEDTLCIDFHLPRDFVDTKKSALLIEGSVGDETVIQMSEGFSFVTIRGFFEYQSISFLAQVLGMSKEFVEKTSNMNNPRCPIKIVQNVDLEKNKFIESILSKNKVEENVEW